MFVHGSLDGSNRCSIVWVFVSMSGLDLRMDIAVGHCGWTLRLDIAVGNKSMIKIAAVESMQGGSPRIPMKKKG